MPSKNMNAEENLKAHNPYLLCVSFIKGSGNRSTHVIGPKLGNKTVQDNFDTKWVKNVLWSMNSGNPLPF